MKSLFHKKSLCFQVLCECVYAQRVFSWMTNLVHRLSGYRHAGGARLQILLVSDLSLSAIHNRIDRQRWRERKRERSIFLLFLGSSILGISRVFAVGNNQLVSNYSHICPKHAVCGRSPANVRASFCVFIPRSTWHPVATSVATTVMIT